MIKKRVLIAPMDWGLGHATRCIPLIRKLLAYNCDVVIAGSGQSLDMLREEFPELPAAFIAPYDPVYAASSSLVMKMAEQSIKFMLTIQKEHRQTQQLVRNHGIDIIISDNRFGCWAAGTHSVFLTHQLSIIMPRGVSWAKFLIDYLNHSHIRKFSECWIPDVPGDDSLSGMLSIASGFKAKRIGWLSRFSPPARLTGPKKYEVAAVLSGPEPQRRIIENTLLTQLKKNNLRSVLVRGKQGRGRHNLNTNVEVVDSAGTAELQGMMESSELILCRSGYSSLMDLIRLGSKAILIPTPGQTEQEYLASRMMEKGIAFSMDQQNFDIQPAMREAEKYQDFSKLNYDESLLDSAVRDLLGLVG